MNIVGMQYDVKQKFNKIDSEQNRNLRIPEIDWNINEAIEIFIKSIAEPRVNSHLGFEKSQRNIDDIRTLVVNNKELQPIKINDKEYYVELPEDYMFYVSSNSIIKKGNCSEKMASNMLRQHDDRHEESPFDRSSFEWGETNIRFYDKGIKIFTDGTFTVDKFILNYIRKHAYVHNAQDFLPTKSYKLPNGTVLTGRQDCELPEHTHREIVDIAVMIMSGNIGAPDYQIKENKIRLNQN